MSTPQAVLFDMDGLLVDTEPLWTLAEHELADRYGACFSAQAKAAIVGTRLDVAVPRLLGFFGVPVTAEEVTRASGWLLGRMVELFTEPLPLLPGAPALLDTLHAHDVPVALVSSSYRVLVDAVLASGAGPFATTVAGDEVVHGKPHPEPYLVGATRLGADPRCCVVLEDSPAGAASGTAAGCAVVVVPSVAGIDAGPRRRVVPSLLEVDLALLREVLLDPAA